MSSELPPPDSRTQDLPPLRGSSPSNANARKDSAPLEAQSKARPNRRLEPSSTESTLSFTRQELVPEPIGARYDSELELLCALAASVGAEARGPAPLSFTALVIAFLFAEDPVSRWFQSYVAPSETTGRSIDVEAILRSKSVRAETRPHHLERASAGVLPVTTLLFSTSARRMLAGAREFARAETGAQDDEPLISTRHLMAAYISRVPSDHRDQLRGWGFDQQDWAAAFHQFLQSSYSNPTWFSRPGASPLAARPPATLIGRYTADDPFAVVDDQLDVEDEAAAFARIAAASTIRPPLAIGVFGEWGSGKTYFMRRIYDHIERLKAAPAGSEGPHPFHREIVQIRFDAWHYIETNLWASLVEYIFTALDRWLMEQSGHNRSEADRVFERLATAQQLKLDALEDVVARRAERRGAELRAERARREYETALTQSGVVQPEAYFSVLLDTLLVQQPGVKSDLRKIGNSLGIDELENARARLGQVLAEAKTEHGRAQIITRSAVAKLGKVRWIIACIAVLVLFPIGAAWLKEIAAMKFDWVRTIHDTVVGAAALLMGVAGIVGTLVRRGSQALSNLDTFRKTLESKVEEQRNAAAESGVAKQALDAESELRKRKQALDAAERALAEADARFTAARQDFESASARGRLNAFIRAKATDGGYAKHLGIIAAIRKDFGQLAALMKDVGGVGEECRERDRLALETYQRVDGFMQWLAKTQDVRLTGAELRSVFTLLEPDKAVACFDQWHEQFANRFEGTELELQTIRAELTEVATTPLPSFSRIILYIDDLDRCPPATVVDVLQAVHLLLSFPLFVVVVAVDARWVSRALSKQYPNLLAETRTPALQEQDLRVPNERAPKDLQSGANPHDYMEKIFQIPYWVRSMNPDAAERYVRSIAVRDVATRGAGVQADVTGQAVASPTGTASGANGSTPTAAAGVDVASRAAGPAPISEPVAESIVSGLTLTDWEVQALQSFAGFIGTTPRRAIRFVNIYRLIKTSLPPEILDTLVGERGESRVYGALIAQLAIVTGAPTAAAHFFKRLTEQKANDSLPTLRTALSSDAVFNDFSDAGLILQVLQTLHDRGANGTGVIGAQFVAGDLQALAPTAQRYSFATPPSR
jgi:hypothetical protein